MEQAPDFTALFKKYPSLKKVVETGVESHDGREEELRSFILSHQDIELIKGNPANLLSAMDEFSAKHDFLISVGGHKAQILSGLVANEKPKTLVELGGYLGYSAILFADALRRYREPNQRLRIWSLEMNSGFASIAREMIELSGLSDIVTVIEGSASESLRKLQNDGNLAEIDLLFLDHEEQLYLTDLNVCTELGLLKKGAVIVADNVVRPGAPEYREFVRTNSSLKSEGIRGLIQPGDLERTTMVSRRSIPFLALLVTIISQASASILYPRATTTSAPQCSGISVKSNNGNRKVAIVIDSSPSMEESDPNNLRIAAGEALNGWLITDAEAKAENKNPDEVAVVDFGFDPHLDYPLGDPGGAGASFAQMQTIDGTFIAGGVDMGIQQLNGSSTGTTSGRSSIIVFTDGEDSDTETLVDSINSASSQGIRVSFGFLDASNSLQDVSVLTAISASGGVYATITTEDASNNFINFAILNGLTNQDNPSGNNSTLLAGLTIAPVIQQNKTVTITYNARKNEIIIFTIQSVDGEILTVEALSGSTVLNKTTIDYYSTSSLPVRAKSTGPIDIKVAAPEATEDNMFTIGAQSNMPIQNCTVAVGAAPSSHSGGLSTGGKVGLGIGIPALVGVIAAGLFALFKLFPNLLHGSLGSAAPAAANGAAPGATDPEIEKWGFTSTTSTIPTSLAGAGAGSAVPTSVGTVAGSAVPTSLGTAIAGSAIPTATTGGAVGSIVPGMGAGSAIPTGVGAAAGAAVGAVVLGGLAAAGAASAGSTAPSNPAYGKPVPPSGPHTAAGSPYPSSPTPGSTVPYQIYVPPIIAPPPGRNGTTNINDDGVSDISDDVPIVIPGQIPLGLDTNHHHHLPPGHPCANIAGCPLKSPVHATTCKGAQCVCTDERCPLNEIGHTCSGESCRCDGRCGLTGGNVARRLPPEVDSTLISEADGRGMSVTSEVDGTGMSVVSEVDGRGMSVVSEVDGSGRSELSDASLPAELGGTAISELTGSSPSAIKRKAVPRDEK
ncbi:hypothetical protein B7463_g8739, partial [Scytalidium lignicola]